MPRSSGLPHPLASRSPFLLPLFSFLHSFSAFFLLFRLLCCCSGIADAIPELCQGLLVCSTLSLLDLSFNNLTATHTLHLFSCFRALPCLSDVRIAHNNIGSAGAEHIARNVAVWRIMKEQKKEQKCLCEFCFSLSLCD